MISFKNTSEYAIKKVKEKCDTKEDIISAAAKIIKEDIRTDVYPSNKKVEGDLIVYLILLHIF